MKYREMSIVQDYLDLTKKYKAEYGEKTLVLMEVGSFFEVYALINPDGTYKGTNGMGANGMGANGMGANGMGANGYIGSNIEEFARINEMVIAKKQTSVNKLQVVMAGVGTAHAERYIQKMQDHGYTLVIYKQDPLNKTSRNLSEIISPGTYFPLDTSTNSSTSSSTSSNNVMCVWLHQSKASKTMPCQITIGLGNIDIYTGKTSLFQFAATNNHSPATYDELERYVSAYRPNECLIVANLPEKIIDDIIAFVGLEKTKIHKVLQQAQAQQAQAQQAQAQQAQAQQAQGLSQMQVFAQNAEKQVYQMEIFKKFFPHLSSFHDMFPTHSMAIQAFCFLLDFVSQHNPNLTKKLTEPVFENYTDRLILSNHTLSQLNIIDDTRHDGKLRSVSALLNNCVTTMGRRQFMYNLNYPMTHQAKLQSSYDMTEHLLEQGEAYFLPLRAKLSVLTDLEKLARKIIIRRVVPKNLATMANDLLIIDSLATQLQEDATLQKYMDDASISAANISISAANISISAASLAIHADLARVFDLEACMNDQEEAKCIINRGIAPTIDALLKISLEERDKLNIVSNYLSALIQQSEKKEATYVKIHEKAHTPALLLCTSRRTLLLKAAIKKQQAQAPAQAQAAQAPAAAHVVRLTYISQYSQKEEIFEFDLAALEYNSHGNTKTEINITSPQIRAITGDHEENKNKLQREMDLVFQNYLTAFAKFEPALTTLIKYVTELDLLQCKAYTANKYNYCKPVLATGAHKSFFDFTGLRHPLIEHLQTQELYVTNDLQLGTATATATACNGILLYGTNAVGKTSFIKSIGIAVIMAQAGLYVPCTSFTYYPYKNVFTRILGNDNLFKGLSTFAVEMTELRTILTMADAHSLVLGDELCSGTESDSALSIFTAGLEILHERECTFLFATHFHEIKNYEEITQLTKLKMLHMAVHYQPEQNRLIYDRKLREGPGESMYGLEVCKALYLPDAFLQRAHEIRLKYQQTEKNVLALSPTHFNAKKLVGNCEICKKKQASEVHHLQHQKNAFDNDYIVTSGQNFHKNHVANLLNICGACHKKIHKPTGITGQHKPTGQQYKVVKTSDGYMLTKL